SAESAKALGFANPRGVRIVKTVDGAPAAQAGILPNDVIIEVDGLLVRDVAGLMLTPEKENRLTPLRGGSSRDLVVHVGAQKANMTIAYLIDAATGALLVTRRESVASNRVTSAAFSPDGRRFAFGWLHGSAEIWSMETLELLGRTAPGDDQTTSL